MTRLRMLFALLLLAATPVLAQLQIVAPADSTVSSVDRQAVTVKSVPGTAVALVVNGEIVRVDTTRLDGVVDFLNVPVGTGM